MSMISQLANKWYNWRQKGKCILCYSQTYSFFLGYRQIALANGVIQKDIDWDGNGIIGICLECDCKTHSLACKKVAAMPWYDFSRAEKIQYRIIMAQMPIPIRELFPEEVIRNE